MIRYIRGMLNRITRTLAYEDAQQERKVISQDEIAAIIEPVVILGDPGLGKSVLTQTLGERSGMKYYRAGTFARVAKPESLISQGERIIIDGLDEIASTALSLGEARLQSGMYQEAVIAYSRAIWTWIKLL